MSMDIADTFTENAFVSACDVCSISILCTTLATLAQTVFSDEERICLRTSKDFNPYPQGIVYSFNYHYVLRVGTVGKTNQNEEFLSQAYKKTLADAREHSRVYLCTWKPLVKTMMMQQDQVCNVSFPSTRENCGMYLVFTADYI